MKKFMALILSVLMLIPMITIGISAENFNPLTDPSLVLHYDFEGDTPYANKAREGQGDLTTPNSEYFSCTNGILSFDTAGAKGPTVSKDYLAQYMTGEAEYTFFARVKLDESIEPTTGTTTIYYNIADMRTFGTVSSRPFAVQFCDAKPGAQDSITVYIANADASGTQIATSVKCDFEDLQKQYLNIAVVLSRNSSNQSVVKVYTSMGLPTSINSWSTATEKTIGAAICDAETNMTLLSTSTNTATAPAGMNIDDIRLYSKALSEDEFSEIIPTGSFSQISINDHLAIHYDFNGENYLENKAIGATKGNLTVTTSANLLHDSDIGTVTNNGQAGLYCKKADVSELIAGGQYDASTNTAGKAVEYTLFARFRLNDAVAGTEYRVVDTRTFGTSTCRPLNITYKDGKILCGVGTAMGHNTASAQKTIRTAKLDIETRFANVAVVVYNSAEEGATHSLKMAIYYCTGIPTLPSDWQAVHDVDIMNASSQQSSTVSPINQNLCLLDMGTAIDGVEMDDFRIYDIAMSEAQVQDIMSYGSFAPDIVNIGVQEALKDTNEDLENDAYSVRFVGGINSRNYDEVGIEIVTTVGATTDTQALVKTATTVYTGVMADGNQVSAADRYCTYFIAFIVDGIPLGLGETVSFEYRFFTVKDGVKAYSETATVSYDANGTLIA